MWTRVHGDAVYRSSLHTSSVVLHHLGEITERIMANNTQAVTNHLTAGGGNNIIIYTPERLKATNGKPKRRRACDACKGRRRKVGV